VPDQGCVERFVVEVLHGEHRCLRTVQLHHPLAEVAQRLPAMARLPSDSNWPPRGPPEQPGKSDTRLERMSALLSARPSPATAPQKPPRRPSRTKAKAVAQAKRHGGGGHGGRCGQRRCGEGCICRGGQALPEPYGLFASAMCRVPAIASLQSFSWCWVATARTYRWRCSGSPTRRCRGRHLGGGSRQPVR
jgi:hypothetical protein